jgi:hypothetical protein
VHAILEYLYADDLAHLPYRPVDLLLPTLLPFHLATFPRTTAPPPSSPLPSPSQVRNMRNLVAAVWGIFLPSGPEGRINRDMFLLPNDGLADAIIANLDPGAFARDQDQLRRDRAMAEALRAGGEAGPSSLPGAGSGAPPAVRRIASPPELPPNIKACPACGMLMEKISGDDKMMCGCEARVAGGTFEKAWAAGGCGHEFNFATLAPLGTGAPDNPHNERQVLFHRH